jgi:hypothetical protein
MNKINELKDTLKRYQTTPEYKKKGQFDLHIQGDDCPIGIYEWKGGLFVLTSYGLDKPIENFDTEIINEIYKQVCK